MSHRRVTLEKPIQVKNFKEVHPRYSAGVFGIMTGASLRALQELLF
ncbi:MAG: hypothetical protein Q8Q42_00915 [Nanoarchaeota archaeon]|nr:hypothetical protein [Nanoarchaeota archaeon]